MKMMYMETMRLSLDPKPIGAFIEYTLKPLIDDSHELLDLMVKHEIKLGNVIEKSMNLYIIYVISRSLVTLISTGMICLTAYYCLHLVK